MAKPTVLIVGADKGGVGKTTVSRTLLDYFVAHQIPTRAFDTEAPKGTLKRFHPDATEVVDIALVPDQMKVLDTLSVTDAAVTVIDVRASLLSPTLRALRDIGFIEGRQEGADHARGVPHPRPLDRLARPDRRDRRLSRRHEVLHGEELHQQHALFPVGRADQLVLLQRGQGCGRGHDPQAQRDGVRTGRSRLRVVSSPSSPTRRRTATPPLIRSCCAAMSGTGWATSGPSTTASS